MYLRDFTPEQKELALDILIGAAKINGVVETSERKAIEQYCAEMGIAPVRYEAKLTADAAEQRFTEIGSRTDERKMLIEVIALVMADQIVDDVEKDFVKGFMKKAEIDDMTFQQIYRSLRTIADAYQKLDNIITEEKVDDSVIKELNIDG